jgi:hypothetical protein
MAGPSKLQKKLGKNVAPLSRVETGSSGTSQDKPKPKWRRGLKPNLKVIKRKAVDVLEPLRSLAQVAPKPEPRPVISNPIGGPVVNGSGRLPRGVTAVRQRASKRKRNSSGSGPDERTSASHPRPSPYRYGRARREGRIFEPNAAPQTSKFDGRPPKPISPEMKAMNESIQHQYELPEVDYPCVEAGNSAEGWKRQVVKAQQEAETHRSNLAEINVAVLQTAERLLPENQPREEKAPIGWITRQAVDLESRCETLRGEKRQIESQHEALSKHNQVLEARREVQAGVRKEFLDTLQANRQEADGFWEREDLLLQDILEAREQAICKAGEPTEKDWVKLHEIRRLKVEVEQGEWLCNARSPMQSLRDSAISLPGAEEDLPEITHLVFHDPSRPPEDIPRPSNAAGEDELTHRSVTNSPMPEEQEPPMLPSSAPSEGSETEPFPDYNESESLALRGGRKTVGTWDVPPQPASTRRRSMSVPMPRELDTEYFAERAGLETLIWQNGEDAAYLLEDLMKQKGRHGLYDQAFLNDEPHWWGFAAESREGKVSDEEKTGEEEVCEGAVC